MLCRQTAGQSPLFYVEKEYENNYMCFKTEKNGAQSTEMIFKFCIKSVSKAEALKSWLTAACNISTKVFADVKLGGNTASVNKTK